MRSTTESRNTQRTVHPSLCHVRLPLCANHLRTSDNWSLHRLLGQGGLRGTHFTKVRLPTRKWSNGPATNGTLPYRPHERWPGPSSSTLHGRTQKRERKVTAAAMRMPSKGNRVTDLQILLRPAETLDHVPIMLRLDVRQRRANLILALSIENLPRPETALLYHPLPDQLAVLLALALSNVVVVVVIVVFVLVVLIIFSPFDTLKHQTLVPFRSLCIALQHDHVPGWACDAETGHVVLLRVLIDLEDVSL